MLQLLAAAAATATATTATAAAALTVNAPRALLRSARVSLVHSRFPFAPQFSSRARVRPSNLLGVPFAGSSNELASSSPVRRLTMSAPKVPIPKDFEVDHSPGPSKYLKPTRIRFTQGEKRRTWDLVESHDAVCILVYHKEKDAIILVRQFRPAVYYRDTIMEEGKTKVNQSTGFTLELPAGLVDKDGKSRAQIAAEEVLEETGYRVSTSDLKLVNKYRASVGTMGSIHDVYYTEVNESMREGGGGGLEEDGENIEVVFLPVRNIDAFLSDSEKVVPAGLLYALQWFVSAKNKGSKL